MMNLAWKMSIFNNINSAFDSIKSAGNSETIGKTLENVTASLKTMPSILSKEIFVEGQINSPGIIEIEGKVKGSIVGNSVIIREDGFVEGKIEVDSISIRGKFEGDLKAKNISVFKKARITGNIEYQSLSVEDGAYIDGQFKKLGERAKK